MLRSIQTIIKIPTAKITIFHVELRELFLSLLPFLFDGLFFSLKGKYRQFWASSIDLLISLNKYI